MTNRFSLRARVLLLSSLVSVVAFVLMFIAAYQIAYHETEEILDQKQKFIAHWLAQDRYSQLEMSSNFRLDQEYKEENIFIDRHHQAILKDLQAQLPILASPQNPAGFYRYTHANIDFIAYVLPQADGTQIQVAQPLSVRRHLALELAATMLAPYLVCLPMMLYLLYLAIVYALRPIQQLGQEIAMREYHNLAEIDAQYYPKELQPIIQENNALFVRIEQAQQVQQAFISHAAHELRSPLTALNLQSTLLVKEYPDSPAVAYLGAGIRRLQHLVKQLLDLARSDSPVLAQAAQQSVVLQQLLREVVEELYPLVEDKQIELTLEASEQDILLRLNRHALYLVIKNIIDNAIKYTPQQGSINLTAVAQQQTLRLECADSGIGIPETEYSKVTERFYRIHNVGIGSGLGLAIVQKALGTLDGQLYFDKSDLGGLLVGITLPIKT